MNNKIVRFCKTIDWQILAMALITTFTLAYYINPLANIYIDRWDRTFCTALLLGISISKRINNFYFLILIYLPLLFLGTTMLYNWICCNRSEYKEFLFIFNIMVLFSDVVFYLNRYASNNSFVDVTRNTCLYGIIGFYIILLIITLIDKQQKMSFTDLVNMFLRYVIIIISFNIFFDFKITTVIFIAGLLIVLYETFSQYCVDIKGAKNICEKWFAFFVWVPAFARLLLEGIYFLIERGGTIQRYYTHITRFTILMLIIAVLFSIIAVKRKWEMSVFAHIGTIVSMGSLSFLGYGYQYIWSYSNTSNMYEHGNASVAIDTIMNGKLPIIDYFSAHALSDVLTRVLYAIIHGEVNGILIDPYNGLATILGLVCLYLIVKALFNADIAILFICFFPTIISGIKLTGICFFSIVAVLYIVKKPAFRSYLLYWIIVLFCALYIYDEGMTLGIGSILAYGAICLLQREWKRVGLFFASGGVVGSVAFALYLVYGLTTGLPIISRIKEWLSLSVGSNSTWATAGFGDPSWYKFFLCYLVVPVVAVLIVVLTLVKFWQTKQASHIAVVTLTFALAEIFYLPRTIVYHNLSRYGEAYGVLLNFIHWSVAMYTLYVLMLKGEVRKKRVLYWSGALGLIIACEGMLVTGNMPDANSVLCAHSFSVSENWELRDNVTENIGKKRVVFDEDTIEYVNRFQYIFDTLLTDTTQTFIDFANVTSLYVLTGRERPFYVGQSPSMLTDLYSQECYLEEISQYDCPLVIMGTTESQYLQQMTDIPHNIRYYKIAEYIYRNYRPLVNFDEYSIWCEKNGYSKYHELLLDVTKTDQTYKLVDYGYDATTSLVDEFGNVQVVFQPYHDVPLMMLPYVWANYDDYEAIKNAVEVNLDKSQKNIFTFAGSQSVLTDDGNYVAFECASNAESNVSAIIIFQDLNNEGARYQYQFTVVPGKNSYIVRASQDYFWDVYNIDMVSVICGADIEVDNMRVLEGD